MLTSLTSQLSRSRETNMNQTLEKEQKQFQDVLVTRRIDPFFIDSSNYYADDSYISLSDLIPCNDILDTNTIQSSNVLKTFLTPTQANNILGIAGFYKRLFPQMLNNAFNFITNPYSFLKTETNLRILFEKLKTKTKQSRKLFVKPKRSKHPIVKTSNKSSQCHSKKAQLQRKCKHSTR